MVVLVDGSDNEIGVMEKMEAHRRGLLHRAFSVFIFNHAGEMLLQRRAIEKYHSGGLWTNACCSHPRPGEDVALAANRRLEEELGFQTSLKPLFSFTYQTEFGNGLTEHEFDHVLAGFYDGKIDPDPTEVEEFRYSSLSKISEEMISNPENFTSWFRIAFPRIESWASEYSKFGTPNASNH